MLYVTGMSLLPSHMSSTINWLTVWPYSFMLMTEMIHPSTNHAGISVLVRWLVWPSLHLENQSWLLFYRSWLQSQQGCYSKSNHEYISSFCGQVCEGPVFVDFTEIRSAIWVCYSSSLTARQKRRVICRRIIYKSPMCQHIIVISISRFSLPTSWLRFWLMICYYM